MICSNAGGFSADDERHLGQASRGRPPPRHCAGPDKDGRRHCRCAGQDRRPRSKRGARQDKRTRLTRCQELRGSRGNAYIVRLYRQLGTIRQRLQPDAALCSSSAEVDRGGVLTATDDGLVLDYVVCNHEGTGLCYWAWILWEPHHHTLPRLSRQDVPWLAQVYRAAICSSTGGPDQCAAHHYHSSHRGEKQQPLASASRRARASLCATESGSSRSRPSRYALHMHVLPGLS